MTKLSLQFLTIDTHACNRQYTECSFKKRSKNAQRMLIVDRLQAQAARCESVRTAQLSPSQALPQAPYLTPACSARTAAKRRRAARRGIAVASGGGSHPRSMGQAQAAAGCSIPSFSIASVARSSERADRMRRALGDRAAPELRAASLQMHCCLAHLPVQALCLDRARPLVPDG